MAKWKQRRRLLALALAVAVLASMVLVQASSVAGSEREMLFNGSFEQGFQSIAGCGAVGNGWGCFTNGGSIVYGFYDDQWAPVVADGQNSQLIELNTLQFAASEADRYAGIFQTVQLAPGATYRFSMQGLMREQSPNSNEDPFRYRVQWGYTGHGSTDWTQVNNWQELPWDKIDDRTNPSELQGFSTTFVAPGDGKITLFVRVWKKWGTAYKELDVNVDAISLYGPGPINLPPHKGGKVIVVPGKGAPEQNHEEPGVVVIPSKPANPVPIIPGGAQQAPTCPGPNLVRNGSFEDGFVNGAVGKYWGYFNNGGLADYGYYDDQWPPVVQDGSNSQLLEINTKQLAAGDQDRYSGIYQVIGRLKPGETYEFSLWGLMREEAAHPDEDMFRYRVQWGYASADGNPSFADITNWTELPWDTIYLRTDPGPMLPFSVQFQAPSHSIVIGIRAWKKWGNPYRELDVNLDAISLASCTPAPPPPPPPPCVSPCQVGQYCEPACEPGALHWGGEWGLRSVQPDVAAAGGDQVAPVEQPGVLLLGSGSPAEQWQPPEAAVPAANDQPLPAKPDNVVVLGGNDQPQPAQPENPGVTGDTQPAEPVPQAQACTPYTIRQGDTLGRVALRYGTTVGALARANALSNPDRVFPGQQICVN